MTYNITLDKKDIMFFCSIIESCERYGFVRTIDKSKPILSIIVSPYYIKEMEKLLELISKTIKFEILEVLND